jgi:hypothetical protein
MFVMELEVHIISERSSWCVELAIEPVNSIASSN